MSLNALSIDPRRLWKGPWRWFSEEMVGLLANVRCYCNTRSTPCAAVTRHRYFVSLQLDCCRPLEVIKTRGIDLDLFCCLARCNSASAELVRAWGADMPSASSRAPCDAAPVADGEAALRAAVITASKQGEGSFLVLSYSRKVLGQTGDGHFSPIGGYHAGLDMVLVLDVARFKYPPHWVPLKLMWEAMQRVDPETGLPRGYVTLRRQASAPLLFLQPPDSTLDGADVAPLSGRGGYRALDVACRTRRVHESLRTRLAAAEANVAADDVRVARVDGAIVNDDDVVRAAVQRFVAALEAGDVSPNGSEPRCVDKLSKEHIAATAALLHDLEHTTLYGIVVDSLRALRGADVAAGGASKVTHDDAVVSGEGGVELVAASDDDDDVVINDFRDGHAVAMSGNRTGDGAAPGSDDKLQPGTCASHGLFCVRVRDAHVMTMLLLSFWSRRADTGYPRTTSAAPSRATSSSRFVRALERSADLCLNAASVLLQSEARAMQMHWDAEDCGTTS